MIDRKGGSPRDVSRLYGIPYYLIKLACKSGALTPRKFGRRSVLCFSDVEDWIRSQPVTKTSRPRKQLQHEESAHVPLR
jgi:hypothetical protein